MCRKPLDRIGAVAIIAALAAGSMIFCQGCGGSSAVNPASVSAPSRLSPRQTQNGTISPSSNQIVPRGGTGPVFLATGNQGFTFTEWLVDGVAVPQWTTALADKTEVSISGNQLEFGNVRGSHSVSAVFTNKSLSLSSYSLPTLTLLGSYSSVFCSSDASYMVYGSTEFSLNSPGRPVATFPPTTQVWGIRKNGWVLYNSLWGQAPGVDLLDSSGMTHVIDTAAPLTGQYALNDSGDIMYEGSSSGSGGQGALFYVQKGWDNSESLPISPDVQGFFMNDAGAIIGTSYGSGSIPAGSAVAYLNGQEVSLPSVQGALSAFSNAGVLTTVPSPHTVNVYGNNGRSLLATITNLDVDTVTQGAGGIGNPYNRVVGCDAAGDIKVIGQSTAAATNGDWGYWDSQSRSFVDVTALMGWTGSPNSSSTGNHRKTQSTGSQASTPFIVKLWCISDTDLLFATVGNNPTISGEPEGYTQYVLSINYVTPLK